MGLVISYAVPALAAATGIALGLFLFSKPFSAIEMQRKFYEKINWRIEPISMEANTSDG